MSSASQTPAPTDRDDRHTSELTSHQLPWGLSVSLPPSLSLTLSLSLSVCSLTSVTAEKRFVQSLLSFSIFFCITIHFTTIFHSTIDCKPWPLPVSLTRSNLKILSATSMTGGRRKRKGRCLSHFWTKKIAFLKSDSMGGLASQFETSTWPFLFHFTWRFKSNKAYLLAQSFLCWPVKRSFATL